MCVVQSSSCKTRGNAPEQFSRRSGLTKLQGSVSTKWLLCRTVGFNPSQLLFSCTLSFRQLSLLFDIRERLLPRWKLNYFISLFNHWLLVSVLFQNTFYTFPPPCCWQGAREFLSRGKLITITLGVPDLHYSCYEDHHLDHLDCKD